MLVYRHPHKDNKFMPVYTESEACTPLPLEESGFNLSADLPYNLEIAHLHSAMNEFLEFLGFLNSQLYTRHIPRLETMLMAASFSGMVGEFMSSTIPKQCRTLVKNRYHNGHPDLLPAGLFTNDKAQHANQGLEIKASRYLRGWQGHNPEDTWLMVFVFDSNRPPDETPKPFRFVKVVGAELTKSDWLFSGRSEKSRRTITASVTESGYLKMMSNWIYRASNL
jgi:hypothetical protein